jgi:hypothetical protein
VPACVRVTTRVKNPLDSRLQPARFLGAITQGSPLHRSVAHACREPPRIGGFSRPPDGTPQRVQAKWTALDRERSGFVTEREKELRGFGKPRSSGPGSIKHAFRFQLRPVQAVQQSQALLIQCGFREGADCQQAMVTFTRVHFRFLGDITASAPSPRLGGVLDKIARNRPRDGGFEPRAKLPRKLEYTHLLVGQVGNLTVSSKVSIIARRPGVCFIGHILAGMVLFVCHVVLSAKFRNCDHYVMLDMSED